MPHGHHIYAKASDMGKATICEYPPSYHELSHWKFGMRCCAKCPGVNLSDQETYNKYTNTSLSIIFHLYHLIARCTAHGRILLTESFFVASVNRILIQNNTQKYTLEKSY